MWAEFPSNHTTVNEWLEAMESKTWMDQLKNSIDKSKQNKDTLWTAFKLFNAWIEPQLTWYNEDSKDKMKIVLWNMLMDNMSITWAISNTLSWIKGKVEWLKDMFSLSDNEDEEETLSDENKSTIHKFANLEKKLEWTAAWDLLAHINSQIKWSDIIKQIWNLTDDNLRTRITNNPQKLEKLLKTWLQKGETLSTYFPEWENIEKDYSTYLTETLKETKERWSTLWKFKKIWDKILDMADKFWMKDSLVWMLDMLYKVPWIGPILKMLFSERIAGSLDQWWVNWVEAQSAANLHSTYTNLWDKSNEYLWFNPIPTKEDKTWEKAQDKNPEALTKEDLKNFHKGVTKYNEWITNTNDDPTSPFHWKTPINLSKEYVWSWILLWKWAWSNDTLWQTLKQDNILKIIHDNLWWQSALKTMDKAAFINKLNGITANGIENLTQIQPSIEAEKKEASMQKEEEKSVTSNSTINLDGFIITNPSIFPFNNESTGEVEVTIKITEEDLHTFQNKTREYNNASSDKSQKINIDEDTFWDKILTWKDRATQLDEKDIYFNIFTQLKWDNTSLSFESKAIFLKALEDIDFNKADWETNIKEVKGAVSEAGEESATEYANKQATWEVVEETAKKIVAEKSTKIATTEAAVAGALVTATVTNEETEVQVPTESIVTEDTIKEKEEPKLTAASKNGITIKWIEYSWDFKSTDTGIKWIVSASIQWENLSIVIDNTEEADQWWTYIFASNLFSTVWEKTYNIPVSKIIDGSFSHTITDWNSTEVLYILWLTKK